MDNLTRLVYDGVKAVNLQNVPEAWEPYLPEERSDVRERVAWIARGRGAAGWRGVNACRLRYARETVSNHHKSGLRRPDRVLPNPAPISPAHRKRAVQLRLCVFLAREKPGWLPEGTEILCASVH